MLAAPATREPNLMRSGHGRSKGAPWVSCHLSQSCLGSLWVVIIMMSPSLGEANHTLVSPCVEQSRSRLYSPCAAEFTVIRRNHCREFVRRHLAEHDS